MWLPFCYYLGSYFSSVNELNCDLYSHSVRSPDLAPLDLGVKKYLAGPIFQRVTSYIDNYSNELDRSEFYQDESGVHICQVGKDVKNLSVLGYIKKKSSQFSQDKESGSH